MEKKHVLATAVTRAGRENAEADFGRRCSLFSICHPGEAGTLIDLAARNHLIQIFSLFHTNTIHTSIIGQYKPEQISV